MSWNIKYTEWEDPETGEDKSGFRVFDTISGTHFGPAMKSRMEMGAFLLWLELPDDGVGRDPRQIDTAEMWNKLPAFREWLKGLESE